MDENAKNTSKPYPMPSGATLHLGRPPWKAAGELRNALARAASGRPFTAEEMKLGLDTLKESPSAGGALVQRVLTALASEQVEAALFACLTQATYEPKDAPGLLMKVTPALFDHEAYGDAARSDYYPICFRVGQEAVGPFLGPLVSMYKEFLKKGTSVPASTSESPPSAS